MYISFNTVLLTYAKLLSSLFHLFVSIFFAISCLFCVRVCLPDAIFHKYRWEIKKPAVFRFMNFHYSIFTAEVKATSTECSDILTYKDLLYIGTSVLRNL